MDNYAQSNNYNHNINVIQNGQIPPNPPMAFPPHQQNLPYLNNQTMQNYVIPPDNSESYILQKEFLKTQTYKKALKNLCEQYLFDNFQNTMIAIGNYYTPLVQPNAAYSNWNAGPMQMIPNLQQQMLHNFHTNFAQNPYATVPNNMMPNQNLPYVANDFTKNLQNSHPNNAAIDATQFQESMLTTSRPPHTNGTTSQNYKTSFPNTEIKNNLNVQQPLVTNLTKNVQESMPLHLCDNNQQPITNGRIKNAQKPLPTVNASSNDNPISNHKVRINANTFDGNVQNPKPLYANFPNESNNNKIPNMSHNLTATEGNLKKNSKAKKNHNQITVRNDPISKDGINFHAAVIDLTEYEESSTTINCNTKETTPLCSKLPMLTQNIQNSEIISYREPKVEPGLEDFKENVKNNAINSHVTNALVGITSVSDKVRNFLPNTYTMSNKVMNLTSSISRTNERTTNSQFVAPFTTEKNVKEINSVFGTPTTTIINNEVTNSLLDRPIKTEIVADDEITNLLTDITSSIDKVTNNYENDQKTQRKLGISTNECDLNKKPVTSLELTNDYSSPLTLGEFSTENSFFQNGKVKNVEDYLEFLLSNEKSVEKKAQDDICTPSKSVSNVYTHMDEYIEKISKLSKEANVQFRKTKTKRTANKAFHENNDFHITNILNKTTVKHCNLNKDENGFSNKFSNTSQCTESGNVKKILKVLTPETQNENMNIVVKPFQAYDLKFSNPFKMHQAQESGKSNDQH